MKFIPPFTDNPELNQFLSELARYVSDLVTGDIRNEDGTVVDAGGTVLSYQKRYIHVKYADNAAGSGFGNTDTSKYFYGIYNSDSPTESELWYDYRWYAVDPSNSTISFGVDKDLFYKILGGRQVAFTVATAAPDASWTVAPLGAIDLEVLVTDGSITNAKLANMASGTIKGRVAPGTGVPQDLTGTQATTLLNDFVGDDGLGGGLKGLVPEPQIGDATKFLKGDGTWAPAAGAVPYFIPSGEEFIVQENYQALFAVTIDVEGILTVDGYLIGVD